MKKRYKSKTHITAFFLSILGVLEMNMHMLQDLLGEYYGLSFIAVAVIMAGLREVTKEPVG